MRTLCKLILPFVFLAGAVGQGSPAASCQNPTEPVNGVTNMPPVPPSSWHAPQSAVVGLDLTISANGKVKDAVVVYSGGRDADEAVLQAVRNWTYSPAMCGSKPVETKIRVQINLKLGVHKQ